MRASGRDIREAVAGRLSPQALQVERGFTLIEVLIVMVVLAVLAAIALTQFLDTTEKAKDADAKSNVGGLATLVETCFVEEEDYGRCDTNAELEGAPGLSYGTGPGEVSVSRAEERTFEVTAVSRAKTDGSNHRFVVERNLGGTIRTCSAGPDGDGGGCDDSHW